MKRLTEGHGGDAKLTHIHIPHPPVRRHRGQSISMALNVCITQRSR